MEAPSFDYSKIAPNTPAEGAGGERNRVVESASASTARQTNDSNFAYILTACALGIIALLAMAFIWLGIGIIQTAATSSHVHGYRDEAHSDDTWGDYAEELDEFESRLWDEYQSGGRTDA